MIDKHTNLGFYSVGDQRFYSKLHAIEAHKKSGHHPHWNFNDEVLVCYDWTKEPTDSLETLYQRRAQQLRDRYDYLILMFSGGSDSTNALYSFLNNDIKLDEIVSFMNFDANGDRSAFCNAEIWKVVLPLVQDLKKDYPWLKHRMIDLTPLQVDYFKNPNNKFDWVYELNSTFNPNSASRERLANKIPEWQTLIDQGKKLCILYAVDKPRILHHDDGRYSFRLTDIIDTACTVKSISGENNYHDELFYWTPDLPEIMIKQAHIIKRYLCHPDIEKQPFISKERSDLAYRTKNGIKYWLSNHGVHSLIYPYWNIDTFSMGKVASAVFSDRDFWFFDLDDQNPIKQHWRKGLDHLWQSIPDYWKNDPGDISKGIKGCWSCDYFLQ